MPGGPVGVPVGIPGGVEVGVPGVPVGGVEVGVPGGGVEVGVPGGGVEVGVPGGVPVGVGVIPFAHGDRVIVLVSKVTAPLRA